MVIVDPRTGSKDLADTFALLDRCTLQQLDFGDAMLSGHGPDGSSITVGIEVKSVGDLLSSISTGRLAGHQVPGLVRSYDHAFLLIHGVYRCGPSNHLQVRRGKVWHNFRLGRNPVPWSYVEGFLLTLQFFSPIRVKHAYDLEEAACFIATFDHWLEKPWEKHRGLAVFDKSREQITYQQLDPVEHQIAKTAASLPGLDWVRGWAAARHFDSVAAMIDADREEWQEIRGIGPVLAKSVTSTIRRRK